MDKILLLQIVCDYLCTQIRAGSCLRNGEVGHAEGVHEGFEGGFKTPPGAAVPPTD